jgi:hypothetical protein
MSDPLATRLRRACEQPPPAPFAPAEAVRLRGRQRARRQALLAASVTGLLLIGGGVALASVRAPQAAPPGSPPTASSASSAPSPRASGGAGSPPVPGPALTAVAPGMLLQRSDLPAGRWAPAGSELIQGPDRWWWYGACPQYRSADYPSLRRQLDVETVSYASGTRRTSEIVELYPAGWGARNLADVRDVLGTCAGRPPAAGSRQTPPPAVRTVVDTGIAGDESLLVREEQYAFAGETIATSPAVTSLVAVVRVGELVATVIAPLGATPDDARALARAAATRLARS